MSVTLNEFKKRFGKKPVDTATPENVYLARMKEVGPKLRAAVKNGEKDAVEAWETLKSYVSKKEFRLASDLLEETVSKLSVNTARATQLRQELDVQNKRAQVQGRLMEPHQALHKGVEVAIEHDDYDDAEQQLADFKYVVDCFLDECSSWNERLDALDQKAKQVELRRAGSGVRQQTQDEKDLMAKTATLRGAVYTRDFLAADKVWGEINLILERLLTAPADGSPAALKKLFEDRRAAAKKDIDYWLAVDQDEAALEPQQSAIASVQTDIKDADTRFGKAEYQEALDTLDRAIGAVPALVKATRDSYESLRDQNEAFPEVEAAITNNALPPDLPTDLDPQALLNLSKACTMAYIKKDYAKAAVLFKQFEGGYQQIAQEIKKQPKQPAVQAPVSPKVAEYQELIKNGDRAQLTTALGARGADLALFRAQPGATKLLDDMVAALGGKADSKEKQDFVRVAMMARFNLTEVTGGADGKGMSTKALPRMYKLFAILPPSHTTDNDLITSVERMKANDTSSHNASTKKIVLKAGKSGKEGGNFDDTTLHEIAHGVDSKFGFMASNGGARNFGGWRNETRDSVKKIAGEGLKFYSVFEAKNVPRKLLETYLDLVMSDSDPAKLQAQFEAVADGNTISAAELTNHQAVKHAAEHQKEAQKDSDNQRDLSIAARKMIKDKEPKKSMLVSIVEAVAFGKSPEEAVQALLDRLTFEGAAPSPEIWKEMSLHPAVDFAANVGLKNGSSGLWDQGDSGAARCAVNGRVYQEAYANDWTSYLLAARSSKVCDYQFRHRMEWFAECYSRFFRDKLAASHPLSGWLQQQKDSAKQPGN